MNIAHDDYLPLVRRVVQHDGFRYWIANPDPGRTGEHPDGIAVADEDVPHSGWVDARGNDISIVKGDSLVAEVKRTKSDKRRDGEKWHRQFDPKYGVFFAFFCAPKAATSVQWWQGLCVIEDDGSWTWKQYPTRRTIDRTDEYLLMARVASGEVRATEYPSSPLRLGRRQAGAKTSKPKLPVGGVGIAIAEIEDNPGEWTAARLVRALRLDMTPAALAKALGDSGLVTQDTPGGAWSPVESGLNLAK